MTKAPRPRQKFSTASAVVLVTMIAAIAALYILVPADGRAEAIAGASAFFLIVLANMRSMFGTGAVLVAFVIGASVAASGCGASAYDVARGTLERTTTLAAAIDHDLAESRRARSAEIRARPDATLEEHREAMAFYDEALEVSRDVRSSVLSTEAAIDAAEAGRESNYLGLAACVLSSLAELVAIATRRIEIPDNAGEVLSILSGFVRGACPRPEGVR